ncbi:hypothetical protein HPB48_010461 [Haemaphysalis longicornis]|uniref:Uncharacterized protein n=1 Tax=Haemaphysalis longicornis TaxID=44386 RepID=A0A9J6H624_HAELO|nr:hypothetical protein HPB48_010461 [Haemaphysalis longicornis]
MLALQFFATGNFLITAGDIIGVHVGTASETVRRVSLALEKKLTAFVRAITPGRSNLSNG